MAETKKIHEHEQAFPSVRTGETGLSKLEYIATHIQVPDISMFTKNQLIDLSGIDWPVLEEEEGHNHLTNIDEFTEFYANVRNALRIREATLLIDALKFYVEDENERDAKQKVWRAQKAKQSQML